MIRRLLAAALLAVLAVPALAEDAALTATIDRLSAAWQQKDVSAYLALWRTVPEDERAFAEERMRADLVEMQMRTAALSSFASGSAAARVVADTFTVREPSAQLEEWAFNLRRDAQGWAIASREPLSRLDGLMHLSLDEHGLRADGLTLRLPDLELAFEEGTLFTAPAPLGPTLLVFVGRATARFHPAPPAEAEQLRLFAGATELVTPVRRAVIRLDPDDVVRFLGRVPAERDPGAALRLPEARDAFRADGSRAYVVDAALPRSPWWLSPPAGDANVAMQTRRGTLVYTFSGSLPESIGFADRTHHKQICQYPAQGRATSYDEDDGRAFDVLSHDISLTFDPEKSRITGQDTLRIRVVQPSSTLQLRLDPAFQIQSIESPEVGEHVFFRVRDQDTVMVSLAGLAARVSEISLRVRWQGVRGPQTIEREVMQVPIGPETGPAEEDVPIEPVSVYTDRLAWYPQVGVDDYATSVVRIDVPSGFAAVSGGVLLPAGPGVRTRWEYRQDRPGKYITFAVGRLVEAGRVQAGSVEVRAFAVRRLRGTADAVLAQARDILAYYESIFGPAPYPVINLALVEGRTPGGHSPPGMVVLATRPALIRKALADDPASLHSIPGFFLAHEIAHQWWGHGVAGENYRERWLSEGIAQYAAALWVQERQGGERFQDALQQFARWARRDSDKGALHLGQRLGHVQSDPQQFRAVVYDKGAYVLHMLRAIVGDAPFLAGLRKLQEERRFSKIGTADLQAALESTSGRPLQDYVQEWVYGTDLPVLRWSWRTERAGSGYRTTVELEAQHVPGPLPLHVHVEGAPGDQDEVVIVPPAGGRFTFDSPGRPREVTLNADLTLLADIRRK